jgi:hypothetical protein
MKEKHLKTQQNIHFMETAKKKCRKKKEFAKKNSLLVISGLFFLSEVQNDRGYANTKKNAATLKVLKTLYL